MHQSFVTTTTLPREIWGLWLFLQQIPARCHFRLPIQMFIKAASSPRLSRDWNALPDSLISTAEYAEDCLATFTSLVRARATCNSLITCPGDWLSFQHSTSKLYIDPDPERLHNTGTNPWVTMLVSAKPSHTMSYLELDIYIAESWEEY